MITRFSGIVINPLMTVDTVTNFVLSGESECLYGVLANHYLRTIVPELDDQFSCLNIGPTDIDVNETFSFLNGTVIREHIARYDNETDDDIIKLSDIIMESCQNWSCKYFRLEC